MPQNIEIKARIASVADLEPRVAALADSGPIPISQDDTFFQCPHGRLKLRVFECGSGELIFYQRANEAGPKTSTYSIVKLNDPLAVGNLLTQAYGQLGRVLKQRTLYLVGRTRVHLDRVEQLDDFLELEVVLRADESHEQGIAEAQSLLDQLGILPSQLVEGAYLDLLLSRDQLA
jgi:predicted adenylyl cyclase CyaB